MIWRSAILAGYVVLAIIISLVYGGSGLLTLLFFYFVVAAWMAFILAWASLARIASHWTLRGWTAPGNGRR